MSPASVISLLNVLTAVGLVTAGFSSGWFVARSRWEHGTVGTFVDDARRPARRNKSTGAVLVYFITTNGGHPDIWCEISPDRWTDFEPYTD